MDTQLVTEVLRERARSPRVLAISALGPLTALAGLGWAIWQPYRITLLDPQGQGFWWLFVQPPLFVILVGALFHFVVAPGLLRDLEQAERES